MNKELKPNEAMLLTAMSFYLLQEMPGEIHNPQILKFFSEIGHKWVQTDETAWCGAFVNYCAHVNNIERSGKLDARSWLNVGMKTDNPEIGDIVVLWRIKPNSWQGHVGLYCGMKNEFIHILGGNQLNEVNISKYSSVQLLGYRKLKYLQK